MARNLYVIIILVVVLVVIGLVYHLSKKKKDDTPCNNASHKAAVSPVSNPTGVLHRGTYYQYREGSKNSYVEKFHIRTIPKWHKGKVVKETGRKYRCHFINNDINTIKIYGGNKKPIILNWLYGNMFSEKSRQECLVDPLMITSNPHPLADRICSPPYPNYPSVNFDFPQVPEVEDRDDVFYMHPSFLGKKQAPVIRGEIRNGIFTPYHLVKWKFEDGRKAIAFETRPASVHPDSIAFHCERHTNPDHAKHITGPYYGLTWRWALLKL